MLAKVRLTKAHNAQYYGVATGEIKEIELESYLQGVVPSEAYESRTPEEALKAQAIAARTYAMRKALDGTTLTDTPTHQSYDASLATISPRSRAAVEATAGLVLLYGGQPIQAYYSRSNGGWTRRTEDVWSTALPYYQSRIDHWDASAVAEALNQGKTIKPSHGVGLSQVGAEYAAKMGVSCADILAFYYPGTVVGRYETGGEVMGISTPRGMVIAQWALEHIGCGYIIGATGWICTLARRQQQAAQYAAKYPDSATMALGPEGAQWDGKQCFDCAQFTKFAAASAGVKIPSGATSQWNADIWDEKGLIGTVPDEAGILLYRRDKSNPSVMAHTGILLGNGETAEAEGTRTGCVRRKLASGAWTHWARLRFTSSDRSDDVVVRQATVTKISGATGSTVNLRKTASTAGIVLRTVPFGATVDILEDAGEWSRLSYEGTEGWMMSKFLPYADQETGYTDEITVSRAKLLAVYNALGDLLGV